MQARLLLKKGDYPEQTILLAPGTSFVGRASGNDIVLADPEISRRHAQFLVAEDSSTVMLEDLGSTNGTFLNGRRLTKMTTLTHQDIVSFGDSYRFAFEGVQLRAPRNPDEEETGPLPDPNQTIARPQNAFANEPAAAPPERPPERPFPNEPAPPPPPPPSAPTPNLFAQPANNPFADDLAFVDEQPAPQAAYPPPAPAPQPAAAAAAPKPWWRRWYVGCGCIFFLFTFFCIATILFLDSYQQGRLLYCGALRPFFEIALSPLGFAPLCP